MQFQNQDHVFSKLAVHLPSNKANDESCVINGKQVKKKLGHSFYNQEYCRIAKDHFALVYSDDYGRPNANMKQPVGMRILIDTRRSRRSWKLRCHTFIPVELFPLG